MENEIVFDDDGYLNPTPVMKRVELCAYSVKQRLVIRRYRMIYKYEPNHPIWAGWLIGAVVTFIFIFIKKAEAFSVWYLSFDLVLLELALAVYYWVKWHKARKMRREKQNTTDWVGWLIGAVITSGFMMIKKVCGFTTWFLSFDLLLLELTLVVYYWVKWYKEQKIRRVKQISIESTEETAASKK